MGFEKYLKICKNAKDSRLNVFVSKEVKHKEVLKIKRLAGFH